MFDSNIHYHDWLLQHLVWVGLIFQNWFVLCETITYSVEANNILLQALSRLGDQLTFHRFWPGQQARSWGGYTPIEGHAGSGEDQRPSGDRRQCQARWWGSWSMVLSGPIPGAAPWCLAVVWQWLAFSAHWDSTEAKVKEGTMSTLQILLATILEHFWQQFLPIFGILEIKWWDHFCDMLPYRTTIKGTFIADRLQCKLHKTRCRLN